MTNNYLNELVTMEPAYETAEGLEFIHIKNTDFIVKQHKEKTFRLVFHFLTIGRECVYAILNADKWNFSYYTTDYIMNHPFAKKTLFMLLQMGKFDIGLAVPSSYHMITNVTPYFHKNNATIRIICSGGSSNGGMMETQDNNKQGAAIAFDLFKLADNNSIRMPVGE
jgi:hypothetical protein